MWCERRKVYSSAVARVGAWEGGIHFFAFAFLLVSNTTHQFLLNKILRNKIAKPGKVVINCPDFVSKVGQCLKWPYTGINFLFWPYSGTNFYFGPTVGLIFYFGPTVGQWPYSGINL